MYLQRPKENQGNPKPIPGHDLQEIHVQVLVGAWITDDLCRPRSLNLRNMAIAPETYMLRST